MFMIGRFYFIPLKKILSGFLIIVLMACSDSSDNKMPVASAGIDQAVDKNATVTLDGSGSSDSDGTIDTYRWEQIAGTVVTLSDQLSIKPFFTAPDAIEDITLRFRLTVTDNKGSEQSDDVDIKVSSIIHTYHPMNDTGITKCGDYAFTDSGTAYDVTGSGTHENDINCITVSATQETDGIQTPDNDIVRAGQDAVYGRDVTDDDDNDGHAGFSFTKLDNSGNAFGSSAGLWSCVQDNVKGLIWEVKTDSGLHNKEDRYSWYNTDINSNGGAEGYANADSDVCNAYSASDSASYCNTKAFVARVNSATLCGANDWRMPSKAELRGIVSYDRADPAIDTDYFPNTQSEQHWTSTPYASGNSNAWNLQLFNGSDLEYQKSNVYRIRLVRNGQ